MRSVDPAPPTQAQDPQLARAANLTFAALADAPKRGGGTLLMISVVAFLAVTFRDSSATDLAVLVGVLLLHEAGHLIGMRAFGFTDLRMLFLPFLGAAVSGRKPGATAFEHAAVSLLGPLPGLLIALPLAFLAGPVDLKAGTMPLLAQVVVMLTVINWLNLLPILPLDGGRLFETLVFSRRPTLDVAFRVVAILVLGWIALNGMPILGVFAGLLVLTLRHHANVAFESAQRRRTRELAPDVDSLSDEDLVALHDAAHRAATPAPGRDTPDKKVWAATVRSLFDRAARKRATLLQTIALLAVWLLGILAGLANLAVLLLGSRH